MSSLRVLVVCLVGVLAAAGAPATRADEVRIFAAGAVQKAIGPLAAGFARSSLHTVQVVYDTVGALRDRVRAGESPHLVIVSAAGLRALADAGRLRVPATIGVGKTGVGLCVPLGGPVPDVSTPEALKAALRAAPSIVHADPARGATAGTHFRKVLGEIGLTEELAGKVHVVPFGGAIADDVAAGKYALGVSQATEIVSNPKVRFAGFLPDPLQLWTEYGAGIVGEPNAASEAFLALMRSPAGTAAFAAIGFR